MGSSHIWSGKRAVETWPIETMLTSGTVLWMSLREYEQCINQYMVMMLITTTPFQVCKMMGINEWTSCCPHVRWSPGSMKEVDTEGLQCRHGLNLDMVLLHSLRHKIPPSKNETAGGCVTDAPVGRASKLAGQTCQ